MDEDIRSLVEETKELVEENNKILHSLRRTARVGFFVKLLYWIIVFGIAAGAFYYVKPYMEQLMKVYDSVKQTETKLQNVQSSFNIKDFFKSN